MAVVDKGCKPSQIVGCANGIVTVRNRQERWVDIATDGADTIAELVGVALRLVSVREGGVATLRGTVTVQLANGINHAVGSEGNGEGISTEVLIPDDILRQVTVHCIGHGTTLKVEGIVADEVTLVTITVEVSGALAAAVAPKRIVTVQARHPSCIVAVGNLTARVAYPAAESCTLPAARNTTYIEAADETDTTLTLHAHTNDAGSVLLSSTHKTSVTAVLEGDNAVTVSTTSEGTDETQTVNLAESIHDEVLDVCTIVQHTEETHILLFRQVDVEVADDVLLTVEGTLVRSAHITDRGENNRIHVEVLCQHGIGSLFSTIYQCREFDQVLLRTNLIDAVFLFQRHGPGAKHGSYGAEETDK